MKSLQNIINRIWDKLLAIIGALCVLLPTSPMNMQYTYRDSGVFLYIGWRILNGELPYRDVWDHKPPVVFYINALGLAIANGSRWGVWLLEFLSLSFAAFVGFTLIRKAIGTASGILSTVLWLLTLVFVIQGGNLTTEYTLPLQFAALWLVERAMNKSGVSFWHWFMIGLTGASAFFTKQTAIGIWLSIILFLIVYRIRLQQIRKMIFELLFFSSGAFAVCIGWVAFFGLQGSLLEFWDAAFKFNLVYSTSITGLLARLQPIAIGIKPLAIAGLFQFAGIGYLLGLLLIYFKKDVIRSWLPLLAIGLVDLPIELILISFSGRTYAHYYMTILPVLSVFAGVTFWVILSSCLFCDISHLVRCLLTIGIVAVILWTSYYDYINTILSFRYVNGHASIVGRIQSSTSPEDKVLLWGAETSVNYFSHRVSPTRFVYQYPLYTQGYANEQMIIEFLDSVIRMSPKLLIDTRNPTTPIYEFPIQTNAIRERIRYLQCHYHPIGETQEKWVVYEYIANNCYP
jgi:hypothetical protein